MNFILRSPDILSRIGSVLRQALSNGEIMRVTVEPWEPTRSLDQNARLHAICHDISQQKQWAGEWLDTESWKRLFVAALYGQKIVPGLDGGFVVFNKRTSKMTVAECSEVIDYIMAWAVDNGVKFYDVEPETATL